MNKSNWSGVLPAITTPFTASGEVDLPAVSAHVRWLLEEGCDGIVALGSLGEGATLSFQEKAAILAACKSAMLPGKHLIAGISGLSTADCIELATASADAGCDGLMVLPAYVYQSDWRETKAHFSAVIKATSLSCMLYNNPIAYGIDLRSEQIRQLAEHENVHAVKDSSGDARRVTAILEVMGDKLSVLVGLDDMVLEGVAMGARGWVAGLVNALPEESVRLFQLALAGGGSEARQLYDWFLPLLRFDTVPKFVQLIKLVQAQLGRGSEAVRAPRMQLAGREREDALSAIGEAMRTRGSSLAASART